MQLTNHMKTLRVMPDGSGYTVSAGTSDLTSSAIDTAGYQGVRIIIGFGAITTNGVQSVKVAQCDTSGGSYADIEGSNVPVADDDDSQIVVIDIFKPRERYLKVLTLRETANAVVDFLIVELYNPHVVPADTSHATVVATEKHTSPAEGTA